ncbi:hypothetical protein [Pararhizobium gei]|uniref:hypothetical protein n=1 Tax=Pararhizobium gei TaxID=1395951 RepID=UPI0023DA7FF8|nr:hypothetical protein [Rhizobium gei]
MKSRHIDLGLLYIALLILVVASIPLIQFSSRQMIGHKHWAGQLVRIEKTNP